MKVADYEYLSTFLMKSSGLALGPGKEYLLESRLVPLAQSLGLADFEGLVNELRRGADRRLSESVTEAMTTNETLFFRDKTPFEDLKKVLLPELMAVRQAEKTLRIWCAAASTGQEPYSLIMLLRESFPSLSNWKVDFTATDISQQMLDRAQDGLYSQFEVQRGLPVTHLVKYFDQDPKGWRVKAEIRNAVRFRKLNLLDNFALLGAFDLIMCRNVLIYFDQETKKSILERMGKLLKPDGFLMLGAAETVLGVTDDFVRYRSCPSAVYASARRPV